MMVEDVFMCGPHPILELVEGAGGQGGGGGVEGNGEGRDEQGSRREGSVRTAVTKRGRLSRFKYKGKKRVFRSKVTRWDFTA